jgi:protein SCO1/2
VVLSADGRVSRAMSSLALQPTDLRLALLEAGNGSIGGLAGRIALLCYGFDAVHGIYTRNIVFLLQISGAITVIVLAVAIALLLRRSRKPGASA